jgi:hypothetical protein
MFEIQEALQEAKQGELDDAARAELAATRDGLVGRMQADEEEIAGPLSAAWDGAEAGERRRALEALKSALARRAYLRTVVDDLADAMGGAEGNVAHRRD